MYPWSHFLENLAQNLLPQMPIRYDTIRWWAERGDSRRIRPYLNTDPVAKLLAHYIDVYDLKGLCHGRLSTHFPSCGPHS